VTEPKMLLQNALILYCAFVAFPFAAFALCCPSAGAAAASTIASIAANSITFLNSLPPYLEGLLYG
jgi:hypothetical protein